MKTLRILTLFSYCFILIKGSMIAVPLVFWLFFTVFSFDSINWIFALVACAGLIMHFTKWKYNGYIMLLSLPLLLSPVVSRIAETGLEPFDYPGFKVPIIVFLSTYLCLVFLLIFKKITTNMIPRC